jgi:hypothetical protein
MKYHNTKTENEELLNRKMQEKAEKEWYRLHQKARLEYLEMYLKMHKQR